MNTPTPAPPPERVLLRLEWHVLRRLDGVLQGNYRTLFRGFGLDLADVREYQPTDDVRRIDWNVTARLNTPYVREYLEDREVTAWFLVDLSPSLGFGPPQRQKRMVIVDFVATLARLLTRQGNRVGAMLFTDRLARTIPPGVNRPHVLRLINDLLRVPLPKTNALTDLAPLLRIALNTLRRRSMIFILSDFILAPGWEQPFALLARRHDVLPVRIYDPREHQLPDLGPIWLQDVETGAQMLVDTSDPRFRQRFAQRIEQRERALQSAFQRAGVAALRLSTEDDLVRSIVRFALQRKRQRVPFA
ncbi:MAG: DUF58 domain-containing protein [Anaerolineae bacterium]|nr:DUF58 domain-containing protein [Thermoflexales bacterium]MDW8054504.1 DUF58 domain-containing protein [Anaerolineae bacterium]MDW8292877.1 DUF58 domain-containing protein [Anaerolineae bacterium]